MASDKRIILITGANSGIGFDATSALVAASSNNHVLMGARSVSKGEKAVKEIQARNLAGTVSFIEIDVTKDDTISAAIKKIEADYGRLDVLVNNAGVASASEQPTREVLRATFETNVFGPALLTAAAAPLLQKSKDPRIINVTSELGSIGQRADFNNTWAPVKSDEYRMSKSALNMLTTCQSYNYKDWEQPAKVWSFCPGYVITNLTGEEDRQRRKESGADSSETSAQGILEIVEGKRDGEVNHFVTRNGKQSIW